MGYESYYICEDECLIPGLAQWVKDMALPWLWCRLAAVTLIGPLVWEPPYAAGAALKTKKKRVANWSPFFFTHSFLNTLQACFRPPLSAKTCISAGQFSVSLSVPPSAFDTLDYSFFTLFLPLLPGCHLLLILSWSPGLPFIFPSCSPYSPWPLAGRLPL